MCKEPWCSEDEVGIVSTFETAISATIQVQFMDKILHFFLSPSLFLNSVRSYLHILTYFNNSSLLSFFVMFPFIAFPFNQNVHLLTTVTHEYSESTDAFFLAGGVSSSLS